MDLWHTIIDRPCYWLKHYTTEKEGHEIKGQYVKEMSTGGTYHRG